MIALPLLMIFGPGCATEPPRIVTEYETIEVARDRYVSVPKRMTKPIETILLSDNFDVYELGAVAKARKVRIEQCNGRLDEIAGLGKNDK